MLAMLVVLYCPGCIQGPERLVEQRTSSLAATELTELEIETGDGDLEVIGDDTIDSIEVEVFLRTRALSELDDERASEGLAIDLSPRDRGARLSVSVDTFGYWADVRVRVPARFAIDIDDGSGDVLVSGVDALELTDGSGDITIEDVAGGTGIVDDSGDIAIDDVGPLSVTDDSGDLRATLVRGEIYVEDDSGDVRLEEILGDAEIHDGSGDILLDDVRGAVTIDDGSGDIEVGDVGSLDVRSDESGEVRGPSDP